MTTSYNFFIVLLSILVAVYVSYIVVGVCLRIAVSRPKAAMLWTVGGSVSMGIGIWAMHFIGMLAFSLPVPVYYEISLTGLSIIPAILSSAIALFMIRRKVRLFLYAITPVLMGLGIAAMHYTGMAAMNMQPAIEYDAFTVALSIAIAIGASGTAMFLLSYQIINNQIKHSFKLLSALVMGLAITGMHYVGMFAARFPLDCISDPSGGISLDRNVLLVVVTLVSVFILFVTQLSTLLDKNISENSFYEAVFTAQANIGEGLLVVENNQFVFTNPTLLRLFYSSEKPLQQMSDLEDAFSEGEFKRFIEWAKKGNAQSNRVVKQAFMLEGDQVKRTIEVALTWFVYLDRVRQLFVFNDITDKKRAEEAIRKLNESLEIRVEERTLELKQANVYLSRSMETLKATQSELVHSQKMASLGSLVAGISHEINTPIGIGVTCASSINEEVALITDSFENSRMKKSDLENFFHHMQESTTILLKNLNRASELISSFKRIAVDQSSDNARMINLQEYIGEAILSMKPQLNKTKITVANNIAFEINIYTHPGALYQVVSNLIQNSIVHGFPENKEGDISITGRIEGDQIKLVYRDNGVGISNEIKHKIFDPFFTTRLGQGGSGLGLSIVYNLIKTTLKGNIEVINDHNPGACFEITLPYVSEEPINV